MTSLPEFHTGIRLMTAFSTIAGAFYLSGCIRAPANYAPQFQPHLHIMAGAYSHIVSIALYLSRIFDGRTSKCNLETSWSTSTQCKLCTNKSVKLKTLVSHNYWRNKVVSIAKPSAKIYIVIFYHAGDRRWNPQCYFSIADIRQVRPSQPSRVRGGGAGTGAEWSALAHPTHASALAAAGVGRLRCESRHLWYISTLIKVSDNIILNPPTTQLKILTEFWQTSTVPCEFWQSTICHYWIHEGNSAPTVWHFSFWFCN